MEKIEYFQRNCHENRKKAHKPKSKVEETNGTIKINNLAHDTSMFWKKREYFYGKCKLLLEIAYILKRQSKKYQRDRQTH